MSYPKSVGGYSLLVSTQLPLHTPRTVGLPPLKIHRNIDGAPLPLQDFGVFNIHLGSVVTCSIHNVVPLRRGVSTSI